MTGAVRTQLVESLRETLGEPIRSVEVVSSGIGGTRRVSKAVGASGKAYAVKEVFNREPVTLGGKDALETEWAALTTLAEMNAAAPRPVAVQFEDGFLVTEWFDGVTFDDACQFEPEGALTFVPPALHALGFIERAFESRIAEVQPYAYAQDYD
ncbi:MAG: hypothetical protein O3A46_05060, partial [Candidatus Poribacteria bacterium]|nr:hypothetical protein [Candidatus Poribacteria bacterium]